MIKKITLSLAVAALAITAKAQDYTPLKQIIGDDFYIGVAINPNQVSGNEDTKTILHNFTTITAENAMKPAGIIQADGSYNFTDADKIVNFAKENGLKMRGHTLCWHASIPRNYMKNADGTDLTKEELYAKHEKYIKAVFEHFPSDVVIYWDVVNEALNDGENEGRYRERSEWYRICGPEFISWAFKTARKYAPANVKLYYNDYNLVDPVKREKCYLMLKELVDSGVPIDGVGMQAHWSMDVTPAQIEESINRFASLGLDVQITEFDLTVYNSIHPPKASERQIVKYTLPYDVVEKAQADAYASYFKVLHENRDKISSVTFWNVNDASSWLGRGFAIRGRLDYPLLFDRENKPKAPFFSIENYYKSLK